MHVEGAPILDREIFELGIPILGICYGAQLIAQQLGGVVGGSDDDVGVEPVNLPLEVRTPEGRAGEGADVDVFEVESDVVGVDGGGDAARREGVTVGVVIGFAERLDAGDDPDMVTAGG